MLLEVSGDPLKPRQGDRQEVEGLLNPVVRLGTTEPQEAGARLAKALAPQAGHSEFVVGPFEQVQSQSVTGDTQPIAR